MENQSEQILNYDELTPFSESSRFLEIAINVMNPIRENSNNLGQIVTAFNDLRRIRVHHSDLFYHIFNNLYEDLPRYILNENILAVKSVMVLLIEFFSENKIFEDPTTKYWTNILIPKILQLSISDLADCKDLAYECLNSISANYHHVEALLCLVKYCGSSNRKIAANALKTLCSLLSTSPKFILLNGTMEWDIFFTTVFESYNSGNGNEDIILDLMTHIERYVFNKDELFGIYSECEYPTLQFLNVITDINYSAICELKKSKLDNYIKYEHENNN